jgi:hypothetical protein
VPDPFNVAFVQRINERFFVRELKEEVEGVPELDPFGPLGDALAQLGVEVPDQLSGYLETMPTSIAATLVTVAAVAAMSETPLTFAWLAGYDYELTVAQADRDGGSYITVILRGPSPSDVAAPEVAMLT